jgi:hypothetical protein
MGEPRPTCQGRWCLCKDQCPAYEPNSLRPSRRLNWECLSIPCLWAQQQFTEEENHAHTNIDLYSRQSH